LPSALAACAVVCAAVRWDGRWVPVAGTGALLLFGAAASALPASVAKGSGELERPVISSLTWGALSFGSAFALIFVPW
jgi:hypothetical protein